MNWTSRKRWSPLVDWQTGNRRARIAWSYHQARERALNAPSDLEAATGASLEDAGIVIAKHDHRRCWEWGAHNLAARFLRELLVRALRRTKSRTIIQDLILTYWICLLFSFFKNPWPRWKVKNKFRKIKFYASTLNIHTKCALFTRYKSHA